MTQAEKFKFEMMSTIELGNECRLLKDEIEHYRMEKHYHRNSDNEAYKECHRRQREAKKRLAEVQKILKSRQMELPF